MSSVSRTIRITGCSSGFGELIVCELASRAVWHVEGGLGTRSKVVKFQLRLDPLAR